MRTATSRRAVACDAAQSASRLRRASERLVAAVAAVAIGATASACSAGPPTRSAPGSAAASANPGAVPRVGVEGHTYRVPQPLPHAAPGTLIAATDKGPDGRFAGARRWTVLYHSVDAHGADIPVSGTVLVPPGAPPPGGRPVVSWAHGTTGVADSCAPSQSPDLGNRAFAQQVRTFLQNGYAVTATDYPGLGTPGMHTYLVGADEGNAVTDIVAAAHHLLPDLAATWFAVGHSQGGQAALFAARTARRSGGLRLGGTVAIAPASHLETMLPGVIASHQSSELSFVLYSLAGLSATDPSVDLHSLIGPTAAGTASRVLEVCLKSTYPLLGHTSTEQALPLSSDRLDRLGREMAGYGDPDRAAIAGPVLVVQGGADEDVPPQWTDEVVGHLRALGSPQVTEGRYPGLGHEGVLGPSSCDLLAFLGAHGGRPASHCVPHPTEFG